MRVQLRILTLFLLLLLPGAAFGGPEGDGHRHGEPTTALPASGSPRVAMPGEIYDVVAIYKSGRVTFYVDRLIDNAPVINAALEVRAGSDSASLRALAEGIYVMEAPAFIMGGAHELTVSITAPGGDDLVAGTLEIPAASVAGSATAFANFSQLLRSPLGFVLLVTLFIAGCLTGAVAAPLVWRRFHSASVVLALVLLWSTGASAGPGEPGHSHGDEPAAVSSDLPHRLPDGSVFLPKPTQRLLEVRTLKGEEEELRKTVTLPGRVIASPHRSGIVQSINGGRVMAADRELPGLGQRVKKGELLARVEPPVNTADETTIADRAGEIRQQIALAEIRLQRLAPLALSGAVPKTQVTDLEADLESLKKRLAMIGTQRRQPEELRAPVDGEIASVRVVAGQVVAPQDQIFHIVDPEAMWVEAFVFGELDPATIGKTVAVGHDGKSLSLRFQGMGRVLQMHTIHLQFAVENAPPNLLVGQPVTVLSATRDAFKGIVLPRSAVIRASNGNLIVWQHAASERFVPLQVRIEPVDGERVAVVAGLAPRQRVVVHAAELINQVR